MVPISAFCGCVLLSYLICELPVYLDPVITFDAFDYELKLLVIVALGVVHLRTVLRCGAIDRVHWMKYVCFYVSMTHGVGTLCLNSDRILTISDEDVKKLVWLMFAVVVLTCHVLVVLNNFGWDVDEPKSDPVSPHVLDPQPSLSLHFARRVRVFSIWELMRPWTRTQPRGRSMI